MTKSKIDYRDMIHLGTWKPKSDSQIPKKSKQDRDIAALTATAKLQDNKIRRLTKSLKNGGGSGKAEKAFLSLQENGAGKEKNDLTNRSPYSWSKHFGTGKDFADKQSLLVWVHKNPTDGKTTCVKNGFTWNWCKNCVRWSPHTSKECSRVGKRQSMYEAHVANRNIIRSTINSSSDDKSTTSEGEWTDDDIETSRPRKRTKKSKRTVRSKRSSKRTNRRRSDSESDSESSDE